jgi:hypothetical protein
MNSTNKKQIQLHKMELDEKYLSRKLVEIADNTPIILSNIRKYKLKSKIKNKGKLLVHEKAFIKMLKINVRIARLLVEKDYVKPMNIFGFNLYAIAEIERFLKNY